MALEQTPAPGPRTVGRAIGERLAQAGARFAFTVPGESFLGVLDGLVTAGVRVVATRHEGPAAFMAEAASQLTGQPQVCLATRAVGASNLAIGIHTARADSAPMIAIVGQVRRDRLGRDAFQEADLVGSIGRLAKWAVQIDDPDRADMLVGEALLRATSGRPGPVLIAVPEDVIDAEAPVSASAPGVPHALAPDPDAVRAILKLLAASQRGAILAGAGVLRANATRRLLRLAEALCVPVIASWRRPDVAPNTHPLFLGMAGIAAAPTVLPRLLEADALLVLGSRLSEMTTFDYRVPGERTRWAHVDLEPRAAEHGLPAPAIAVASDVGRFVDAALSLLRGAAIEATGRSARLEATARDRQAYVTAAAAPAEVPWHGPGVHPGRTVSTLGRLLPPEGIVTTDAGNFGTWLARGYRFRRPGTFLGPTSGAMGYGLPAAIAAALVHPRRPVAAVCGDGGFAMTMAELETAVREGVAPVALVFDNRRYGTIRAYQEREGREATATELGAIDFCGVARSMGALGISVTRDEDVGDALREALGAGRPAVVQLQLDPAWVSVDEPPGRPAAALRMAAPVPRMAAPAPRMAAPATSAAASAGAAPAAVPMEREPDALDEAGTQAVEAAAESPGTAPTPADIASAP